MRGVAGLETFVRLANESTDEIDALFFQRTAQVLASGHGESPLAVLSNCGGFPVAVAKDGTVVTALEWDCVSWTENAAAFVQAINQGSFPGREVTGHRAVLTGVASPLAKEQLAALGILLNERALPGPLR